MAGNKEKVLDWMNRAFHDKIGDLLFDCRSAPEFDLVRPDPRYEDLQRRMHLLP